MTVNGGVFDKDKVDQGISAVCDALNGLDLNLFERWWVCHTLVVSISGIIGKKYENLKGEIEEIGEKSAEGDG